MPRTCSASACRRRASVFRVVVPRLPILPAACEARRPPMPFASMPALEARRPPIACASMPAFEPRRPPIAPASAPLELRRAPRPSLEPKSPCELRRGSGTAGCLAPTTGSAGGAASPRSGATDTRSLAFPRPPAAAAAAAREDAYMRMPRLEAATGGAAASTTTDGACARDNSTSATTKLHHTHTSGHAPHQSSRVDTGRHAVAFQPRCQAAAPSVT